MLACVVMPDHLHLVIRLDKDTLANVMKIFKGYAAKKTNDLLNRKGSVFQNQYFEHYIRQDEGLINIVKCCWENPMRKGLVDYPGKWPYWKSKFEMD